MGISPSKISTINSPSLSFLDRNKKSTSKRGTNFRENRSSNIIKSTRLSLLSRHSKMEKRGVDRGKHQDAIMTNDDRTETMTSSRRSSRRRTRSMALNSQDDVVDEDSSEPVTSRRIRRRMKGKSRLVEEDKIEISDVASSSQTKGKKKETQTSDMDSITDDEDEGSAGETLGHPLSKDSLQSNDEVSSRPLPPMLDDAPTLAQSSDTNLNQRSQQRPSQNPPTSIASQLPPSTPNPFDLTTEERFRARAQIAQALGIGAAAQLTANRSALSDQSQQPSMLSALLTDILGLRSGQSALSETAPGSRTHGTSLGNRDTTRPRINGGTSVIVQGALISRTLPSHRPNVSTSTTNASNGQQGVENSSMQRSQSQPPPSVTSATGSSIRSEQDLSAASDGDTQVATIEEQAAMLIRLLSIATAATAASLVSRPSQNQRRRQNSTGSVSSAALRLSPLTNTALAASSTSATAATPARNSRLNGTAPATSPSTTSSNPSSSSWRQASHTYQILRERFSALRSRFRGQRVAAAAAAQVEEPTNDAASYAQENDQSDANANQETTSATSEAAPEAAPESESRVDEDAAGSLSSLSSMLQDAIRDGVQNPDRGSRSTERRPVVSSVGEQANSQSQSVHATLDAVRGGQLSRGEDGSFDRFLFDLMSDLDIAVRGLPRESGSSVEANEADLDEVTRLRRERDMHDGQLSFFRLFTFPAAAAPQTTLAGDEQQQTPPSNGLLPCVVVGVRSLESSQTSQGERPNQTTQSSLNGGNEDTIMQEDQLQATVTAPTDNRLERGVSLHNGRPMSRFLLFVSGGHYPPQHPLFHSSTDDASRDLMVLMEFLGAMASMHAKPHTTVTKDQIEKSNLQKIIGGLDEISTCVKEGKIMENTSERCLICLEDWKDEGEDRRLLGCAHLFHAPCIDQWLTSSNNSCPLCRRQAIQIPGAPSPGIVPSIPVD